jgi:hypothetical protein
MMVKITFELKDEDAKKLVALGGLLLQGRCCPPTGTRQHSEVVHNDREERRQWLMSASA